MPFVLLRNHNSHQPISLKRKQILLALLCSSRQRIVLQQCFFSFRSFAASPSVTSTLYFFRMSHLTVDTVKANALPNPPRRAFSARIESKRKLSKSILQDRLLAQLALGSEVCSGQENQQHDSADTAREPRSPTGTNASSASSGDAGSTDLSALVRDEV